MVHKTCPECSGMLPVASKQCPCGYVFSAKKLPSKPTERKVEIISSRLRPERAKKNYAMQKAYVTPSLGRRQHNKGERSDNYDSDDEDSMDRSSECQREDDDSPNYHPENERASGRPRRELRSGGKENGGKESSSSENGSRRGDVNGTKGTAEEPGEEQLSTPRRPRGRPKGSKDKKPRQPKGYRDMGLPTLSERFSQFMDSSGRPMDSMKVKRQRLDYPHDSNDRYLQPWQIDLKDEYMLDYESSSDIYMNISSEKREIFKLILEDINSKISRQNFKPD